MKAKEFILENKKGRRAVKHNLKPRNHVATAPQTGAGEHKDKKRAEKQGDFKHKNKQIPMESLREFSPAGSGTPPRGPKTPGRDPWGGNDGPGDDPYSRPDPEYYSRSIDFFGKFEADHFDDEQFDKKTGIFKGYWDDEEGRVQIAYFKFDDPKKTGSDDPGMGWYYEPQNEDVAEGEENIVAVIDGVRSDRTYNDRYHAHNSLGKLVGYGKAKVAELYIDGEKVEHFEIGKKYIDFEPKKLDSSMEERYRDPEDWDEGNTEPANNFAVYINGKKWKVFKGRGYYADDERERQHYYQLKDWARKKSEATGKKWEVSITGEPATE